MKLALAMMVIMAPVRDAGADPERGGRAEWHDISGDVTEGDFLPWLTSATHDRPEVRALGFVGRDESTGTTTVQSAIEATLIDRVSLRGSFANDGYRAQMRPTVGLTVDVLRQARAGVDLAVGGAYTTHGYNEVPALLIQASIARHLTADTTVLANFEYGAGLEQGERYGAASLGAVQRLTAHWFVGLASRAHVDLERDDDEPAEERDWDVQAGPVVSYALGPIVLSASGGAAAWQLRLRPDAHIGAAGMLGAGAVF